MRVATFSLVMILSVASSACWPVKKKATPVLPPPPQPALAKPADVIAPPSDVVIPTVSPPIVVTNPPRIAKSAEAPARTDLTKPKAALKHSGPKMPAWEKWSKPSRSASFR